jgi:hypothetical protein
MVIRKLTENSGFDLSAREKKTTQKMNCFDRSSGEKNCKL